MPNIFYRCLEIKRREEVVASGWFEYEGECNL
jgi:hypothetical protein